jgi:hypothetical protein
MRRIIIFNPNQLLCRPTNQQDEMGRACGMYRGQKFIHEFGREGFMETVHLEDLGMDGK